MNDASSPPGLPSSPTTIVLRHSDFVTQTASALAESIVAAVDTKPFVVVALSGGKTPIPVFEELSKLDLPWEQVVFTFGDERSVPPDHVESNFRMAKCSLLDGATAKGARVLRIEGELPPDLAAEKYEHLLRKLASERGETVLKHDLLMLGLGDDGHTASLFPGSSALKEKERWVVANHVTQNGCWRITFTYPLINAAREVRFLVNDRRKEKIIQNVLLNEGEFPALLVRPTDGKVFWHLGHVASE